jgi:hypothetical protein
MTIKLRWQTFVDRISGEMKDFDEMGAFLLKESLMEDIPPDESILQWAMAYIEFQHSALKLTHTCCGIGRIKEALFISQIMEEINNALVEFSEESNIKIPKESLN